MDTTSSTEAKCPSKCCLFNDRKGHCNVGGCEDIPPIPNNSLKCIENRLYDRVSVHTVGNQTIHQINLWNGNTVQVLTIKKL